MIHFILSMGPFGELNIIILFAILIMALRNAYVLFISRNPERIARLGRSINAMLFWGVIVVLLGFLGTFLGASSMMNVLASIEDAGTRIIPVMMAGICKLLVLVNFSLGSFTAVALVWYLFTWRHRKLLDEKLRNDYRGV